MNRAVDATLLRPSLPARLVVAAVGLAVIWAAVLLAEQRVPVDLAIVLLLLLALVLVLALVTGPVLGILTALATVGLVNWYLVAPYHTLTVASPDNVVALIVFTFVAGVGSALVELNGRIRARAARTQERAGVLRDVVSQGGGTDPTVSLERVRLALDLDRVSLVRSEAGTPRLLATTGSGPEPGSGRAPVVDVRVDGGYRLVGAGPERIAEDPAFVESLAAATVRSYESGQMETERQRAEELAAVDQARTALLASVGHDLRTPLAGLRLAVDALRAPDSQLDPSEAADLLETVDDATSRLDELITNLLDMSRLEAGVLLARTEPTAVDAAIAAAVLAWPHDAVTIDVSDSLPLVTGRSRAARARAGEPRLQRDPPRRAVGGPAGGRVRDGGERRRRGRCGRPRSGHRRRRLGRGPHRDERRRPRRQQHGTRSGDRARLLRRDGRARRLRRDAGRRPDRATDPAPGGGAVTTLLVVEDDDHLRKALVLTLRSRGYDVVAAASGADALAQVGRARLDVVILDLGLPDIDGLVVIERIRSTSAVPIVVLSARRDQADKVGALDAGADDYLTKPFGIEELLARLRAAQRRAGAPRDSLVVATADFEVDLGRKQVRDRSGTEVHLTPTEWGVLEVLVRADGLLVSGADLLREVWGPQYETQTNYLRVYLAQLRAKLEPDQAHPRYLITAAGLGYRFDATGAGG